MIYLYISSLCQNYKTTLMERELGSVPKNRLSVDTNSKTISFGGNKTMGTAIALKERTGFEWGQVETTIEEAKLDALSNEDFALLYFPPEDQKRHISPERCKKILLEKIKDGAIRNLKKVVLESWTKTDIDGDEVIANDEAYGILNKFLSYAQAEIILKWLMEHGTRRTGNEIMVDTFGRVKVLGSDGQPLVKEQPNGLGKRNVTPKPPLFDGIELA